MSVWSVPSLSPCIVRFRVGGQRVEAIIGPSGRIVDDVLTNPVQGHVVADDMFEVIALPDVADPCVFPHPFRYTDFEPANDGPDRF